MTLDEFCMIHKCTKPDAEQMIDDCKKVFPVFRKFSNGISRNALCAILNEEEVSFAAFYEHMHAVALASEIVCMTEELGVYADPRGLTKCVREIVRRRENV